MKLVTCKARSQLITDFQKFVMIAEIKNELVGKIDRLQQFGKSEQLRGRENDRQLRDALGDQRPGACDFIN